MILGLVVGLLVPTLSHVLSPAFPVLIMTSLALTFFRLDLRLLLEHLRHPWVLLALLVWGMAVVPVLTWGALTLLPVSDGLYRAILLNAVTPPILGAPAGALLLGLSVELAAAAMVIATVFSPVLLVAALTVLPVGEADVDPWFMIVRAGSAILLPMAVAVAARWGMAQWRVNVPGKVVDGALVAILTLIAAALMDGANAVLARDTALALQTLAASLAFNVGHQALAAVVFSRLGLKPALLAAIVAGNRNLGLTLGALGTGIPIEFSAIAAFGQIPIYSYPLVYRRLMARFGMGP